MGGVRSNIDIVKGFSSKVVLTCSDLYTRYIFAWVLGSETASAVAKPLEELFVQEGPPKVIVCDNGACFTAKDFRSFADRWGINVKYIPRYSGFYGGFYEKNHHIMVQTLILMIEQSGEHWRRMLPLAVRYMNLRPYEFQVDGKSLSPFEVFKGREVRNDVQEAAPVDDPRPTEEQLLENIDDIMSDRKAIAAKFEHIWKDLRAKSFATIEDRYRPGKSPLKLGDKVMRWVPERHRKKIELNRWEGPLTVEKVISEIRVIVNWVEEHVYNLRKFVEADKPVATPPQVGQGSTVERQELPPTVVPLETVRPNKRKAALDALDAITTSRTKRERVAASVRMAPRGSLLWM